MDLLEMSLDFNYFEFNNKMYHQKDGLAMGNSLAGTLADIFINHIENTFFMQNKELTAKIVYYRRYVDDIIVMLEGSDQDINLFKEKMNNMHNNIKFTLEMEENNSLNFLDLTITKLNNQHKFAIYRKPSTSDVIIHADSCHPDRYKKSFFNAMTYRILRTPLQPHDIQKELNILRQIATANGYEIGLVDKIYNKNKLAIKNKNQGTNKKEKDKDKIKYIPMIYRGRISDRIDRNFRKQNVKLAFQTDNTLQLKLRHNVGDKKDKFSNTGVYKLKCSDCDKFYIGQTGRTFKTRFREHTYTQNKTAFGIHLKVTKHKIDSINQNMEIIHKIEKGRKLDLLENINIYQHHKKEPDKILNDQLEVKFKNYFAIFDDVL